MQTISEEREKRKEMPRRERHRREDFPISSFLFPLSSFLSLDAHPKI
jgi:hypothetical protein